MMKIVNPGSLNVRLGAVLAEMESCLRNKDLPGYADFLEQAASYLSVHLTQNEWKSYFDMPGFIYGDTRDHSQIFKDLQSRLRYLLLKAKPHGVFSKQSVETGDASILDQEEEDDP